MHFNCIYFFCIMDYGIRKNFGLALPIKFRIHQSVIQNMHFTFKNPSLKKKAFWIHKSVTEIWIPNSRIHNRISLPDSAIRKSIIYAKIAFRTPPHPEKKNIQFRIDESVAHSQILISGNYGVLFQIKD